MTMIPSDLQDYGFEHMYGTWNKNTDFSAFRIDVSMYRVTKQIAIYTNSTPSSRMRPGSVYDLDIQLSVYKLETALKVAKLYGFI
jgi:hypothetical protein